MFHIYGREVFLQICKNIDEWRKWLPLWQKKISLKRSVVILVSPRLCWHKKDIVLCSRIKRWFYDLTRSTKNVCKVIITSIQKSNNISLWIFWVCFVPVVSFISFSWGFPLSPLDLIPRCGDSFTLQRTVLGDGRLSVISLYRTCQDHRWTFALTIDRQCSEMSSSGSGELGGWKAQACSLWTVTLNFVSCAYQLHEHE